MIAQAAGLSKTGFARDHEVYPYMQAQTDDTYLKADSLASVANQVSCHHGEVAGARPYVQESLTLFRP